MSLTGTETSSHLLWMECHVERCDKENFCLQILKEKYGCYLKWDFLCVCVYV
jgi:hypothetical protein